MPLPPFLSTSAPSVLDFVCAAPRFVSSDQFFVSTTQDRSVIIHRTVKHRGEVDTVGFCFVDSGCILRGDMARIRLGNMTVLESDVLVRPGIRCVSGREAEVCPVNIGCCTVLGKRLVSEAASIGAFVVIEKDCCLGNLCVVGNGVWLRQGSVVPPLAVLEPFYMYEGDPAVPVARLSEDSHPLQVRELVMRKYQSCIIG